MKKNMTFEQIFAMPQDKVQVIMKEVREKCKNDKIFEQELIKHPTEIFKKEGLKLQAGISLQFVKTEEEVKLLPDNVIPITISHKKGPLSPEQLKKVAGGLTVQTDGVGIVIEGPLGTVMFSPFADMQQGIPLGLPAKGK